MSLKKKFFKALLLLILSSPSILNAQSQKNTGYFNITEFGYHYIAEGKMKTELESSSRIYNLRVTTKGKAYSLRTINGFFLTPHYSLGLGAGIEGKSSYYDILPIFIDFRAYLKDARNTPYAYVDAGYSPKFGIFEKAWVGNLGIGYKFFIGKRTCLVAGAEFNYARKDNELLFTTYTSNSNSPFMEYITKDVKINQHTFSFKFGFLF